MKFSINKTELASAVSIVLKGVSTRSTLPVLSGILLHTHKDTLTLQTTDLELSIKYSVPALVEEEGKTVIPGKLFSDIVKSMPDAAIQVKSAEDHVILSCDNSSFSIKVMNAEDFPSFPEVAVSQQLIIPFELFSSMIKKVVRTVSRDESRPILMGVLISLDQEILRMVSTDSYRLAITEAALPECHADGFQAVIGGIFLSEIASLPRYSGNITIGLAENQIVITCGDTIFINRRIEGNFPNYRQLLPESYNMRATINVDSLVAAVKRASILGSSSTPVKLDFNIASQTVQLSSIAQDVGSAQESIEADIVGENVVIAFNYSYVLDGLSVIGTDNVHVELQSELKPGIFRSEESENFLYLVMPVRI